MIQLIDNGDGRGDEEKMTNGWIISIFIGRLDQTW